MRCWTKLLTGHASVSPGVYLSGTVYFFVCLFVFFTAIGDNMKCDTAIVHNLM